MLVFLGIIIGCVVGLLLALILLAVILTLVRLSKSVVLFSHLKHQPPVFIALRRRRRARALRYLKSNDDHPHAPVDHQIDQPRLLSSSSPVMLPSVGHGHQRPHSASSTTSSIIMHQINDGVSDRESLIKPSAPAASRPHGDIDNFYEEIKEQQQQTALALSMQGATGDASNHYLVAKKPLFQGKPPSSSSSSQPIRDHHEVFYYECDE